MGYLIDILIGAVSRIVTGELGAHVEPVARWIIVKAVERLPADSRARYREEWLAHMAETPGLLRKLWHAFGCHIGAIKVASVLAQRAERASKLMVVTESKTVEILLARRRASVEINERFLRRVGADLHDGPTQLITQALLRLDNLRPLMAPEHAKSEEFEKIRGVLSDCVREMRHLSAGLAPPHLESQPLQKLLELAVRQHEQRTGSTVNADIDVLPADMSPLHKVCIYRFVQQGLQNAYRHAAGIGQRIHAFCDGNILTVEVADDGPGFSPSKSGDGDRLGLAGMRDRIESLGGTFSLETHIGSGTIVRACFPLLEC